MDSFFFVCQNAVGRLYRHTLAEIWMKQRWEIKWYESGIVWNYDYCERFRNQTFLSLQFYLEFLFLLEAKEAELVTSSYLLLNIFGFYSDGTLGNKENRLQLLHHLVAWKPMMHLIFPFRFQHFVMGKRLECTI